MKRRSPVSPSSNATSAKRARRAAAVIRGFKARFDPDGGWSIRNFAAPEAWGKGNRAEKLRAEPEFATTPSDGHMTGLAVIVLREAGLAKDDPRLAKAVAWLKSNQRESGVWWTRSLNTDKSHFITYSSTAFPLLALAMCDDASYLTYLKQVFEIA